LSDGPAALEVDLRGVPCPVNWARAKVRLERAERGERFAFLVDDPKSTRDMPRAAEASAYVVLAVEALAAGGWRIVIEA
jgi:TusA-related sulfurtransferase